MQQLITSSYEHKLAAAYHRIDKRGLLLDTNAIKTVGLAVEVGLSNNLDWFTREWGFPVYIGSERGKSFPKGTKSLNLNAPEKVLQVFKELGYSIPKIRRKDEETDEYEYKESVAELACRKLMADPSLWPHPAAGEAIKRYLDTKETITFKNRCINAKLRYVEYGGIYYSTYSVGATVTGRRNGKKHFSGKGGNPQNFPARTSYSNEYRKCIIARPGKIFLFVDQKQAEDWPVQALAKNYEALEEMKRGVNRHYKFASLIFNRSIDSLKLGRAHHEFEAELQYNLGKRGRHANNYGMRPPKFSEILTQDGYSVPVSTCEVILDKINKADPNVDGVYHKYIQERIYNTRVLRTPLGRERQFFGVRPNDKNYKVLNEGYSWIPQSVVGDNTGIAVLILDGCNDYIVQEGHDSIVQELPDNLQELLKVCSDTEKAFDRTIEFDNGINIDIPIEGKVGRDWFHTVEIKDWSKDSIETAYKELNEKYGDTYDHARRILPSYREQVCSI